MTDECKKQFEAIITEHALPHAKSNGWATTAQPTKPVAPLEGRVGRNASGTYFIG
jgi:hypothetical protein